jgi:hypothetical protein
VKTLRLVILLVGALLLAACVAIAGKCELSRQPVSWSLACDQGGTAVVVPPSTLSTMMPAASGARP